MQVFSRLMSVVAALVVSAALIATPASAEVKPTIGSGGVVYGFASKPTAASQAPSLRAATTYFGTVWLFEHNGLVGPAMGAREDQPDLEYWNDRTSSLSNIGTGYAICFYWNSNYHGKWIRLGQDMRAVVPGWMNDQISSLRAVGNNESC